MKPSNFGDLQADTSPLPAPPTGGIIDNNANSHDNHNSNNSSSSNNNIQNSNNNSNNRRTNNPSYNQSIYQHDNPNDQSTNNNGIIHITTQDHQGPQCDTHTTVLAFKDCVHQHAQTGPVTIPFSTIEKDLGTAPQLQRWPPISFSATYGHLLTRYEVRESLLPNSGQGLFYVNHSRNTVTLPKGSFIGVYGGTVRPDGGGPYTLRVKFPRQPSFTVDAAACRDTSPVNPWTVFGRINSSPSDPSRHNCKFLANSVIITTSDLRLPPCGAVELLVNYSDEYDWSDAILHHVPMIPRFLRRLGSLMHLPPLDFISEMETSIATWTVDMINDPPPGPTWISSVLACEHGHLETQGLLHNSVPVWDGDWEWWVEQVLRCTPFHSHISFKGHNSHRDMADFDTTYGNWVRPPQEAPSRSSTRMRKVVNYGEGDLFYLGHAPVVRHYLPAKAPLRSPVMADAALPAEASQLGTCPSNTPIRPLKRVKQPTTVPPAFIRLGLTMNGQGLVAPQPSPAPQPDPSPWASPAPPPTGTHRTLKVCTWNAGGLSALKQQDLQIWIWRHTPDLVAVVDVQLDKRSAKFFAKALTDNLSGVGYTVFYTPPPPAASARDVLGGSMFIVKSSLSSVKIDNILPHGAVYKLHATFAGTPITCISTYWPVSPLSDAPNSWCQMLRRSFANQLSADLDDFPAQEVLLSMRWHIENEVAHASRSGSTPILLGDFNSSLCGHDNHDLLSLCQQLSFSPLGVANQCQMPTWTSGRVGTPSYHQTRIDYILVPNGLASADCIPVTVWREGQDHKLLAGSLRLPCSPTETHPKPSHPRLLRLQRDIKINTDSRRERHRQKMESLPLDDFGDGVDFLAAITDATVKRLVGSGRAARTSPYLCPPVVSMLLTLDKLSSILAHLRGTHGTAKWTASNIKVRLRGLLSSWERSLSRLTSTGYVCSERDTHPGGIQVWKTTCEGLLDPSEEDLSQLLTDAAQFQHQLRKHCSMTRRRLLFNEWAAARKERAILCEEGRLRRTIDSLLEKDRSLKTYKMESVRHNGEVVTDAHQVHNLLTSTFRTWFAAPGRETQSAPPMQTTANPSSEPLPPPLPPPKSHIPTPENYAHWGGTWEEFCETYHTTNVPQPLLENLHSSLTRPLPTTPRFQEWQQSLLECPTLDDFNQAIQATPVDSAPGFSGLSYNMIRMWTPPIVERVHQALSESWKDYTFPEHWQHAWLVPIPKTDDPTLDDLRPLSLLDALRKIWLSIFVRRIQQGWSEFSLLCAAQEGSRPNCGTDTAILRFLNCMEGAKEVGSQVYLSSWDMKRAFDSVPKSLLTFAWMRMGIPESLATYLTALDVGGTTVVRTPLALDTLRSRTPEAIRDTLAMGFTPEMGTGQGDVVSPLAWSAVFDILLTALQRHHFETPAFTTRDLRGYVTADGILSYVDDLLTIVASHAGLQQCADLVSAFSCLVGIRLAHQKFRAFAPNWGLPSLSRASTVTIHTPGWTALDIPLQSDGTFKWLGVHWDLSMRNDTQFRMLKLHLLQQLTLLRKKKATAKEKWKTLKTSVYEQIAYVGKYCSWTLAQYHELERPIHAFLRELAGVPPSYPTALLYIRKPLGLDFYSLSSLIQHRKYDLMMRGFRLRHGPCNAAVGGLLARASAENGSPILPDSSCYINGVPGKRSYWATSILEWLHSIQVRLFANGPIPSAAERPLHLVMEAYAHARPSCLSSATWGEHYMDCDPHPPDDSGCPPCATSPICVRTGQLWMEPGSPTVYEVTGFLSPDHILILPWKHKSPGEPIGPGSTLHLGMAETLLQGSSATQGIRMTQFCERMKFLLHASAEEYTSTTRRCKVQAVLRREPSAPVPILHYPPYWEFVKTWVEDASVIFTDGSFSTIGSLGAHLKGTVIPKVGTALVKYTTTGRYDALFLKYDSFFPSGAYLPELIGLLLASMHFQGTIYTDCASALSTTTKCRQRPWGFNPLCIITDAFELIPHVPDIQKVRAHPERRSKDPTSWTFLERGIFLADLVAGQTHPAAQRQAAQWTGHPMSIDTINVSQLLDTLRRSAYVLPTHMSSSDLIIGDLKDIEQQFMLQRYCATRDQHRNEQHRQPKWSDSSLLFPTMNWTAPVRSMSPPQRAAVLRSLWDKYLLSAKYMSFNALTSASRCRFCHTTESHAHILCECTRPCAVQLRDTIRRDAAAYVQKASASSPSGLRAALQKVRHFMDSVDMTTCLRWTGVLPAIDVEELSNALLQPLDLSQLRIISKLMHIYAEGAKRLVQQYLHYKSTDVPKRASGDLRSFFAPVIPHSPDLVLPPAPLVSSSPPDHTHTTSEVVCRESQVPALQVAQTDTPPPRRKRHKPYLCITSPEECPPKAIEGYLPPSPSQYDLEVMVRNSVALRTRPRSPKSPPTVMPPAINHIAHVQTLSQSPVVTTQCKRLRWTRGPRATPPLSPTTLSQSTSLVRRRQAPTTPNPSEPNNKTQKISTTYQRPVRDAHDSDRFRPVPLTARLMCILDPQEVFTSEETENRTPPDRAGIG